MVDSKLSKIFLSLPGIVIPIPYQAIIPLGLA